MIAMYVFVTYNGSDSVTVQLPCKAACRLFIEVLLDRLVGFEFNFPYVEIDSPDARVFRAIQVLNEHGYQIYTETAQAIA
ncbi:hypothetical protein VZG28_04945 [Synechococcus elongatus IITB4]|uniref:hypothetical protein n=1 Tax=Synechococcus elongatus TaxID=32046 RepID=UPI0030CFF016